MENDIIVEKELEPQQTDIRSLVKGMNEIFDYDKALNCEYPLYEIIFRENHKIVGLLQVFLLGDYKFVGKTTDKFKAINHAYSFIHGTITRAKKGIFPK